MDVFSQLRFLWNKLKHFYKPPNWTLAIESPIEAQDYVADRFIHDCGSRVLLAINSKNMFAFLSKLIKKSYQL